MILLLCDMGGLVVDPGEKAELREMCTIALL